MIKEKKTCKTCKYYGTEKIFDKEKKIIRVDKELDADLRAAAAERIRNRVDKKFRSSTEMTGMMRNTDSYPELIRELKTKRKKEDII